LSRVEEAVARLDCAREERDERARLFALRTEGEGLAEALRVGPRVRISTLRLGRVLLERAVALPTLRLPTPLLVLERRAWLVEHGGEITLVDPASDDAFSVTPFGERVASRHPLRARALAGGGRLLDALRRAGVEPRSVRRAILTGLRYQHLGGLLDALPEAEVFVPPAEHARALAPALAEEAAYERAPLASHPRLVRAERLVLPGLVVVGTPGVGDSASVVACDGSVRVLSPHGVALDAWSPYESRLPGLREALRLREIEALPRGDAHPIAGAIAMGLERTLADRRRDAPAFLDVTPSLELVPSLLAPIAPTLAAR
jgi:glyoxylase-like metal-dependent hydrolase (beta-lactamase superfamily II)